MANKRASYVTTRNINKARVLLEHGATTNQISRIMNIGMGKATYLRTLVKNKEKVSALKNLETKSKVETKKAIVSKKPRVSNAVIVPKENINVIRTGNNITVTINLAI